MSSFAMLLDGLMIVLLVATIVYAWELNRRLATWRSDKGELEKLIERFNQAAQRAETGIATLKAASEDTGRTLNREIVKAQSLRDDLAFLIERAEPIADRLMDQTRGARPMASPVAHPVGPVGEVASTTVAPPVAPPAAPLADRADPPLSQAERNLLMALQARR